MKRSLRGAGMNQEKKDKTKKEGEETHEIVKDEKKEARTSV